MYTVSWMLNLIILSHLLVRKWQCRLEPVKQSVPYQENIPWLLNNILWKKLHYIKYTQRSTCWWHLQIEISLQKGHNIYLIMKNQKVWNNYHSIW